MGRAAPMQADTFESRDGTADALRVAIDLPSGRRRHVEFLLDIIEGRALRTLQLARATLERADVVVRELRASGEARALLRVDDLRAGSDHGITVEEPLRLASLQSALERALAFHRDPGRSTGAHGPQAVALLSAWRQHRNGSAGLLVRRGGVELAMITERPERRWTWLVPAQPARWNLLFPEHETVPIECVPQDWAHAPRDGDVENLQAMLWRIAEQSSPRDWLAPLHADARVRLRAWPYLAAGGPISYDLVLRRLRAGTASVRELLALPGVDARDVTRFLNATFALESLVVDASTSDVAAPSAAVERHDLAPTRVDGAFLRLLGSIRRALVPR